MPSRALRALVLIALVSVVGCGPFAEQPAPTPSLRSQSCRGATGLLRDFVDAFNSRDRDRLRVLLASNVHLVDDLQSGRRFESTDKGDVLKYIDARLRLGESFQEVTITPGKSSDVAGMVFTRSTLDSRLFGTAKVVTPAGMGQTGDCNLIAQLIMQSSDRRSP